MPSDVLITPATSKIDFTDASNSTKKLSISGTTFSFNSNLNVLSTTSLSSAFKAEGVNGTLFEVTDDLSNSLMSVNTIGGLPVFEVFANNSIIAGQYNANDFVISGNKIGLGYANPVNKLSISGSVSIGASYNVAAPSNGLIVQGNVGIGTITPSAKLTIVDNTDGGRINLVGRTSDDTAAINFRATGDASTYAYISPDTNEFRLYHNDGFMSFYPGGTEKWRITAAGVLQSNNTQTIQTSTGNLTLATAAGNGHVLLSPHGAGNVGIGTATPSAKFNISLAGVVANTLSLINVGSWGNNTVQLFNSNGGTTGNEVLLLGCQAGGNGQLASGFGFGRESSATWGTYISLKTHSPSTSVIDELYERVRITADGNVGIGTTTPASILTVQSNGTQLRLQTSSGPTSYFSNIGSRYDSSHPFTIEVSNGAATATEYFGIYADAGGANNRIALLNGNVGIGTTNPIGKLTVQGNIEVNYNSITADAFVRRTFLTPHFATNRGANIAFGIVDGGGLVGMTVYNTASSDASYNSQFIAFHTHEGNVSVDERMRITPRGNVGIGTISPADKLHVIGNIRINGGDILNWSGQAFIQTIGANDMFFRPNSTLRMILTTGGNLGLGNGFTNPLAKLHINSTTSGAILLKADGTNGTLFSVSDDLSNSLMSVNTIGGLPVFEVFANNSIIAGQYGQNDFVISGNKVGIGTSSPSYKLHVNGSLGVNAGASDGNWPFIVVDSISSGGASRYALNKIGAMGFNYADSYAQLQLIGANGAYIDFGNASADDSDARIIYQSNNRFDISYGTTITLNSTGAGVGVLGPNAKLHVLTTAGSVTAPNVVAIFQANTATTIIAGGGTAIKFVGVSSGGNLQDYDQCMISSLGYVGNNQHGMQFWVKPNASTVLTAALTINADSTVVANSSVTASSFVGPLTGNVTGTASTATNATQLGGAAASSYIRNDTDGTAGNIFSLITVTKSLMLTTSWIDTGISGTTDLAASGAYILTMNADNHAVGGGHYNETYTGIMYWYAGGTNDTGADEIPLHKSGHAPNAVYINLRTLRNPSGTLKLQIISSAATNAVSNYIFKFRRMI